MKKVKCPACNGEGEIFSGYYGHPETSDGKAIIYKCSLAGERKKLRR